MPISVGEIEAVLTARDRMSEPVIAAAQQLKQLNVILNNIADDGSPKANEALKRTTDAITLAEANFIRLRDEAAGAAAGLSAAGTAADSAAKPLDAAAAATTHVGTAAETSASKLASLTELTRASIAASEIQAAVDKTQAASIDQVTAALNAETVARQAAAAAAAGFNRPAASPLPPANPYFTPSAPPSSVSAAKDSVSDASENYANLLFRQATIGVPNARLYADLSDAKDALGKLTTASNVARVEQDALARAAAATSMAMANQTEKTTGAAGSMEQMDRMATRMVERLLILAAVRGTFNFVTGLYESADALVRLNEQTDVSIGKLQEIKYAADITGVTFATAATGIDSFQKKIGEAKAGTADALASIGLSFSSLFNLNADQRLDAVVAAIAKMPSHLDRVAAEAKLFGTDAIDPLIEQFRTLGDTARTSGKVLEDETVKSLSNTARAYRDFKSGLETIATSIIITTGNMVYALSAPGKYAAEDEYRRQQKQLYGDINNAIPGEDGHLKWGDTQLPSENIGPPDPGARKPGGPTTGKAYIDELIAQSNATKVLTETQREQLGVLKSLNLLDAEHAVRISNNADGTQFTTDQLKEYVKTLKDGTAALKEYNRSEQALQEILAKAAADKARYEGENKATGTLQDRLAAVDAEVYADQVRAQKRIGFTKDEWEAEYAIWQAGEAKKQNLFDASSKIEEEILSKAAADQHNIEARNKQTGSLEDRISVIDDEVYHEQQVAQRRLNNDEEFWRIDYAIWQAGEAKKQALIDESNHTEQRSEEKLQNEITAARDVSESVGLQRSLELIDARITAEESALDGSKIGWENYYAQLALIEEKSYELRKNAAILFRRQMDKELINIQAADQSIMIDMYTDGIQQQLAINEVARRAAIAQQNLKGATPDVLLAEDKLYDDRAKAIIAKFDPIFQAWKGLNADMGKTWADTWTKAFEGTDTFVKAITSPFAQLEHEWLSLIGAMVAGWENQFIKKLTGIDLAPTIGAASSGVPGAPPTTGYSATTPGGATFRPATGHDSVPATGPGSQGYGVWAPGEETVGTGARERVPPTGLSTGQKMFMGGYSGVMSGLNAKTDQGFEHAMMTGVLGNSASEVGTNVVMAVASGGLSVGVSAAVAAIKYLMRDRMPEDIARDAGEKFGQVWSDSLVKEVTANSHKLHNEVGGELLSLADIVKEHPIDTTNIDMYEGKVHDVFSMIATGVFTVKQGTDVIDSVFPAMAAAATDSIGRISDKMKELISLNDTFGTQSKAIKEWQMGQATSLSSDVGAVASALPIDVWDKVFADVENAKANADGAPDSTREDQNNILQGKIDDATKHYNDLKKAKGTTPAQLDAAQAKIDVAQRNFDAVNPNLDSALATQKSEAARNGPELQDMGTAVIGSYAAEIATGKSSTDALKDNHAAISVLQRAYKDLGIEVTDVGLKTLFMQNTILTNSPSILSGLQGLTQAMVNQDNLNLESAESFAAKERQAESMYVRLQDTVAKSGGGTADALRPMQDYLHAATEEAKKLNVPLSAFDQMLVQQSKDAGIWQDDIKPKPTIGEEFEHLTDAVHDLIDALHGIPPKVHTDVTVDTNHTTSGTTPPPVPNPDGVPPGHMGGPPENTPDVPVPMAKGGYGTVSHPTMFLAGESGPEDFAFSGSGTFGSTKTPFASPSIFPLMSQGSALIPRQETNTGATPSHTFYFQSTIYLTSDDTKDPDRVLDILDNALVSDRRQMRTKYETIAVKAISDAR